MISWEVTEALLLLYTTHINKKSNICQALCHNRHFSEGTDVPKVHSILLKDSEIRKIVLSTT